MRQWMAVAMLIVFAVASATAMHAQQPDELYTASKEQLDVVKVVLAQQDAWNKGDIAAFASFYKDAPDTEAVLGAPVRGLAHIRSAFAINFPNPASMGHLDESEVEARTLGASFALVTGTYVLSRSRKNGRELRGTFTDVLEKLPAGWKIVFSQTT